MERLEQFAALLFQNMPAGAERERACSAVLAKLQEDYSQYLKDGLQPEEALSQTLICYGAVEAAEEEYRQQRLLSDYWRFHRKYKPLIRWGLAGLMVIPLLLLALFSGFGSRLLSVICWVCSLAVFIGFLLVLEYMDYRCRRRISPEKRELAPPEQAEQNKPAHPAAKEWRGTE